MKVTLKTMEKLDDLLDEAEEYIGCAMKHADDSALKMAYLDLARCHYDGYENLSRIAEQSFERKKQTMPESQIYQEMVGWHKEKFLEKANKVKSALEQAR